MTDLFELTFQALELSLQGTTSETISNSYNNDNNNNSSKKNKLEKQLLLSISQNSRNITTNKFIEIQKLRKLIINKYQLLLLTKDTTIDNINTTIVTIRNSCELENDIINKRIHNQKLLSIKRMKELVLEIIGEYGKSSIRVNRRQELLVSNKRNLLIVSVWKMRWDKFILKLRYDLLFNGHNNKSYDENMKLYQSINLFCCRRLDYDLDNMEIQYVMDKFYKKYSVRDKNYVITAVLKIAKPSSSGNDKDQSFGNQPIREATTVKQFIGLLSLIELWLSRNSTGRAISAGTAIARSRPNSAANNKTMDNSKVRETKKTLLDFISTERIEYFHPSSFSPEIWNSYCNQLYPSTGNHDPRGSDSHIEEMNEFARRYCSQHLSTLSSSRLYFCLEERCLFNLASPMSARSSSDEKRDSAELTFDILQCLQVVFYSLQQTHPYTLLQ